jgi:hypothetical protein
MFDKLKKAVKSRKEKKAKSKKQKQELAQPIKPIFGKIEANLNEVQLLHVLKGLTESFTLGGEADALRVRYVQHPQATPMGLMQFWADVETVAKQNRHALETAPGTVNSMAGKSMDFAVEQKQYDLEDNQGVAVRSGPAVAAAMRTQSFVPSALKQIANQLQAQHETVEAVKALADSPEKAAEAVKKLTVGEAVKQLEEKHGEDKTVG